MMNEYPLSIVSHLQATHGAVRAAALDAQGSQAKTLLTVALGAVIPSKKALGKFLNEIIFNPGINKGR